MTTDNTTSTDGPTIGERYRTLSRAQKVPKGVPAYTLLVNRPAGRLLAAASPAWVTPNGLTLFGAALSYAALIALWFFQPPAWILYAVWIALVISYIVDSADGQLSRLRRGGSAYGEWLDHVVDAGRVALLHISVAAYFIASDLGTAGLAWPALYLVAATLIYSGGLLVDKVRPRPATAPVSGGAEPAARASRLRAFLMLPVDYGVLCLAFVFLPWVDVFFVVYAVLAAVNALFCVAYLIKWARELKVAS